MNDWVNAEQHAERARTFFQNGEWDKALAELSRAIELNPEQGEWHFGMGLTLDALSRFTEAIASYEQALHLRGDDPEVMMHIAIDSIHLGHFDVAVQWLERCNELNPQFEPGYCYRIAAFAQLGDHERAEEMFYLARQIQDECPHCYDHLAHSLEARGLSDKAIWCWQQTLRLAPDHADVRASLGRAHVRKGQLERAGVYFEQQLAHHPDDLGTRLHLGRLQMNTDRWSEAGRTFRSILDVNPLHVESHSALSEIAMHSGHIEEVISQCQLTAQLDPDYPGIHHRWALALLLRGQFDRACSTLSLELDKPDHSPKQAIDISRTLMDIGMMPQAIALLGRVIQEVDFERQHDITHPLAHVGHGEDASQTLATMLVHRGYAYLVTGCREAGIADCRRALKLVPGNALTLHNLAMAYLEGGQLKRAASFHRKAAALRPKDAMIRRMKMRIARMALTRRLSNLWIKLRGRF